jgi:hypothetical protein
MPTACPWWTRSSRPSACGEVALVAGELKPTARLWCPRSRRRSRAHHRARHGAPMGANLFPVEIGASPRITVSVPPHGPDTPA